MTAKRELTVTETCQRLGIVPNYVYQLLRAQRLNGRKVDGVWRIPVDVVEAWDNARSLAK